MTHLDYGLNFTPFVGRLVAPQIGDGLKPWHVALIVAPLAVNLSGICLYHL